MRSFNPTPGYIIPRKPTDSQQVHEYEVPPHTSRNGYHLKNLQTINAKEGVEKSEASYTVGGNVNWYSQHGEQYGGSLRN